MPEYVRKRNRQNVIGETQQYDDDNDAMTANYQQQRQTEKQVMRKVIWGTAETVGFREHLNGIDRQIGPIGIGAATIPIRIRNAVGIETVAIEHWVDGIVPRDRILYPPRRSDGESNEEDRCSGQQ